MGLWAWAKEKRKEKRKKRKKKRKIGLCLRVDLVWKKGVVLGFGSGFWRKPPKQFVKNGVSTHAG